MRNFCITLVVLLAISGRAAAQPPDSLLLMFWNLENFFDYTDQGQGDSDAEFSSSGSRHWTRKRFYAKCSAVAKTVFSVQDHRGQLPDVIGVAEIENLHVLEQLLQATQLKKNGYSIIHQDSPDPRGIDVAILYRKDRLRLESHAVHRAPFPTRDMLSACFTTQGGDSIAVVVNHHPSKYSGAESEERRRSVVSLLASVADSLATEGWRKLVATGDFNEQPDHAMYAELLPQLRNLSLPLMRRGEGSIRFNGEWELIDLCFATPAIAQNLDVEIYHVPFLTTRDSAHAGEKPLRTYSGPRYLGGVSDHYPVLISLVL